MRAAPRELAEQLWALCLGCLGNVTNPRTAHPKQVVRPWERPRESSREVSYSWFLTLRCREIYGTGVTTMEQQVEFGSIRRWNHLRDRARIAGKARARARARARSRARVDQIFQCRREHLNDRNSKLCCGIIRREGIELVQDRFGGGLADKRDNRLSIEGGLQPPAGENGGRRHNCDVIPPVLRFSAFRLLRGSPCAFLDALFSCCIVLFLGMGIKRKKGSVLGEAMYEVNFIKARRLVKGQPEYLIKWKGFDDDKYDTWEGLANLSGLEPDLATFEAQ